MSSAFKISKGGYLMRQSMIRQDNWEFCQAICYVEDSLKMRMSFANRFLAMRSFHLMDLSCIIERKRFRLRKEKSFSVKLIAIYGKGKK